MSQLKQITIIGVGLIGGSFALAAKKYGFAGKIVGCDNDLVLEKALSMRVIDSAEPRPETAIKGSDVVLLATPVGGIIDLIERIGPLLPAEALLTDVGSTKAEIVRRADQVFGKQSRQRFFPGHPMAGKAHSGITHADPDIYRNAVWIFTSPHSDAMNSPGLAADFADLIRRIGARPVTMDVERHDRLTGWISHLPQMVSTALAATLMDEFGNDPELQAIGGRALREMTRTAASPYSWWRDVAHTNTENLQEALLHLEQRLAHIRENLRGPALRDEFERGNAFRAEPEKNTRSK